VGRRPPTEKGEVIAWKNLELQGNGGKSPSRARRTVKHGFVMGLGHRPGRTERFVEKRDGGTEDCQIVIRRVLPDAHGGTVRGHKRD